MIYYWLKDQEDLLYGGTNGKWTWNNWRVGRFENFKNPNINSTQMGSNGTHKNKTYLSKEKNSKVHIRIGKCI